MANCHATNKNYLFGHNIKERVKLSMKTTYKILLMVISLLLVVAITIGTSYSLWKKVEVQTNENIVNSACYDIAFEESSNINLKNAMPISDASGLKKTPYTFTIKNTCNTDSKTTIAINVKNTSTMNSSAIKTSIKSTPKNTNSTPVLLTSLNTATIDSSDSTTKESYIITTDTIGAYNSKTFSLYLWMDESVGNEEMNKAFNATISVTSEAVESNIEVALYQGLIPVTYNSNGDVVVADTNTEWYNYDKHKWANAVLVNCSNASIKSKYFNDDMSLKASAVGTTISMDEILQMYVYIPRYRYLLWNAENGTSSEQMINIEFENTKTAKSTGSKNGEWLTHPAFTFGDTELPGIWVGKFESTGSTDNFTIKPNEKTLVSLNVSSMFNLSRTVTSTKASIYGTNSNTSDSHMMKNVDWGAVIYLSHSIYGRYINSTTCIDSGCEIWENNINTKEDSYTDINKNTSVGYSITGCSGTAVRSSMSISSKCASGYDWTSKGVNASTTGNQYGIYDMSGGSSEYVMGVMLNQDGSTIAYGDSGFNSSNMPDKKYYSTYSYKEETAQNNISWYYSNKLGEALNEVYKGFWYDKAWYSTGSWSITNQYPWLNRGYGSSFIDSSYIGSFAFARYTGGATYDATFRNVITAS